MILLHQTEGAVRGVNFGRAWFIKRSERSMFVAEGEMGLERHKSRGGKNVTIQICERPSTPRRLGDWLGGASGFGPGRRARRAIIDQEDTPKTYATRQRRQWWRWRHCRAREPEAGIPTLANPFSPIFTMWLGYSRRTPPREGLRTAFCPPKKTKSLSRLTEHGKIQRKHGMSV